MKKARKIIIILLVLLILAGAACGGIYAYTNYQDEKRTAEVTRVGDLNWGYYGDETSSSGMVTNDYSQSVNISSDDIVKKINVAVGDTVSIGDTLLEYDTTAAELEVEMKQLEIQGIENDIILAKRELENLNKITPVAAHDYDDDDDTEDDTQESKTEDPGMVLQVQEKAGGAYNYISQSSKAYKGTGSSKSPLRFLCNEDCYVEGAYINYLIQRQYVATFEIWYNNDTKSGNLRSAWTLDGALAEPVDPKSRWSVATKNPVEPEPDDTEAEAEADTEVDTEEETEYEVEYTQEELTKAINEKKSDLKELDIKLRTQELALKKLKKKLDDGAVLASVNGTVKTVGDPEKLSPDGGAFIEVSGSEGLYVKGSVSELMLDSVKPGQKVTVNSWSSGQTYQATITEISQYPETSDAYSNGGGNPNVSYYPYTAYIEDTTGLKNGEYVDLSMTTAAESETDQNALYIEKAYVRQDGGKWYVLKADKDNKLKKQYITVGKTVYGSAIEIKSGLSEDDRIAFPYGKTAKEGTRVVEASQS